MKTLLTLFALMTITASSAQKLTQNESTKRWEYVQVFEADGTSASTLYKRIVENYIQEASTVQVQTKDEKIVLRYHFRLGTFKWAKVTETFNIKEGRIRWKLSNIVYLKSITAASKYKQLDKTSDKRIIKKVNKLLPDWVKGIQENVIAQHIDEQEDDWD